MDDQVLCLFLSSRSPPSGSRPRDLKDDGSLSDSRAAGTGKGTRGRGRGRGGRDGMRKGWLEYFWKLGAREEVRLGPGDGTRKEGKGGRLRDL